MPTCPFCNQNYYGTPTECPSCHKALNKKQIIHVNISNSNRNNNIGENIKKLANILLWVGIISSFVCAFVFGKSYDYYSSVFDFWKFIIILLGGGISSLILYLFMYGFGSLVESSINTENNSAESLKLLEKIVIMQQDRESK